MGVRISIKRFVQFVTAEQTTNAGRTTFRRERGGGVAGSRMGGGAVQAIPLDLRGSLGAIVSGVGLVDEAVGRLLLLSGGFLWYRRRRRRGDIRSFCKGAEL